MFCRLVIITLFLLSASTAALAQDCVDYLEYMHVVDSAPLLEGLYNFIKAADVVTYGDYFYLAMEDSGLVTAEISADDTIKILSTVPTWDRALAVTRVNDQIFVADGYAGLQVFGLSDPSSPQWLAHIDTPGWARDVEAIDQRAFILETYLGLVVIDTHEVRSPRIVASLSLPGSPKSMVRSGDLMFIACGTGGLVVVNIADLDQPTILHILDIPSQARDVAVQGNLLAVADEDYLLQLYTMVTPQYFEPRGSIYSQYSSIRELAFHGGLLLAGGLADGLGIINVDDPDTPYIQGSHFSAFGDFTAFTMMGERLVAANAAVDLLDFTRPELPSLVGSVALPGQNGSVATYGDFAYLSNEEDGLLVMDLSDLASPAIINIIDYSIIAGDIAVRGDYLYVTGVTMEVDVYSLEDPAFPTLVGSVTGGAATHLSFHDNLMILAGHNQLFLYDLSTPEAPSLLSYRVISGILNADIQGMYLYLATGYGGEVQVWDISDPSNPQQVSSFEAEYFNPITVVAQDNFLYVSNHAFRNGFVVLDISDPFNILQAASLPLEWSRIPGVLIDNTMYWASTDGPIQLIDVQDPTSPQQFSFISNQDRYTDLDIRGHQLVALGYSSYLSFSLDVAPLHCSLLSDAGTSELPRSGIDLSVFPNPFNPQTTIQWVNDKPRHLKMTVYDLAGRRVAILADRIFEAGPCSVDWNGRSDNGTALPSGIFLVSLKGDNIKTSRRICLVR